MEGDAMAGADGWQVVAAAAQGTSHIRHGQPYQDAYATETLSSGELLIAVADGAGSARAGGVGAQLAVEGGMAALSAHLGKYQPTSRCAWRLLFRQAFAAAQRTIHAHAAAQEQATASYATTLLLGVLHDQGVACGLIGDCVAVVRDADGSFQSLCSAQKGEYANATNLLTQPNALSQLDIQIWPFPVTHAAFFTDGLAMIAMDVAKDQPHTPFFEPLFTFIEHAENRALAAEQLTQFLSSARVNARTDDDKTLLLVQRVVADD